MFKPKSLRLSLAGGAGLVMAACAVFACAEPQDSALKIEKRDIVVHIAPPAFADIDANKDGAISQAEFDAFHASHKPLAGMDDLPPPPPGGRRMRIEMTGGEGLDANKDGKISFEEFSAPLKAHFNVLDADRNGVLDDSEMPKSGKFEHRPKD